MIATTFISSSSPNAFFTNEAAWRLQIGIGYTGAHCPPESALTHDDPKKIDLTLLSVDAEKLSQREWDSLKFLNPMSPSSMRIATPLLEHRGDIDTLNRLKTMPDIV